MLRPGDDGFDPENREQADTWLKHDTDGALGTEQLDAIGRHTEPFTRKMEALRAEGGDEAVAAEVERGEARVLATIYGGREPHMAAGLKTIKEAATLLAGEGLVRVIDESQVLTDPQSHTALLGLARMLLKRFPDGPPQG